MLLREFFSDHYLAHKPDLSQRTVKLYDYSIRKYGQWLGERPTLEHLNNSKVGQYLRHLCSLKDAKKSSVDKERRQLLAMWRFAHLQAMVDKGPVIGPIKIPETIPTALSVPQLRQLRLSFDLLGGSTGGVPNCDFMRACFSIQYATAARIGSVLQLRFDDVAGDVITFRAETRKGGRKSIVKAVPLFVIQHINAIRAPSRELIFPLQETNKTKIHALYSRLFERAGVPRPKGKSSHLMRSTHATLLELAGGDATKSLGHANRSTTLKSYLDPRANADRSCDLLPDLSEGNEE